MKTKGSADAVSVVQTLLTQEEKLLSKEEALACVEHLAGYVDDIQTQVKPSELLKALADSIGVIHERVRKKPAVATVAAYSKAMTALMPVIPGPSRALREVDIMEDKSVWATLDEGCNTTCHPRKWRDMTPRNSTMELETSLWKRNAAICSHSTFAWDQSKEAWLAS